MTENDHTEEVSWGGAWSPLTAEELAALGESLERLHREARDDELEPIEAVSRLVNRLMFRRWQTGDTPQLITDIETGDRL